MATEDGILKRDCTFWACKAISFHPCFVSQVQCSAAKGTETSEARLDLCAKVLVSLAAKHVGKGGAYVSKTCPP